MAFSSGDRGPRSSLSEINVTPLVDVMLVLLIIFMISAPLLQSGVELELPKGNVELEPVEDSILVSIDGGGKHYLNDEYLQPSIVIEKIKAAVNASKDKTVYLRGDKALNYGKVMDFLSYLRENGIEKVSLITEPIPEEGK